MSDLNGYDHSNDDPLAGYDLTFTGTGELLVTHGVEVCLPPCALHSPSDHHMVTWPLHWRSDRRIMERVCSHGIGHPDPDDIRVHIRTGLGVHGCDGCCRPDAFDVDETETGQR